MLKHAPRKHDFLVYFTCHGCRKQYACHFIGALRLEAPYPLRK